MSTLLLQTKLYIPPPRSKLAPCPHLIERLNEDLHREFTLIPALSFFVSHTLLIYNVRYSMMLSEQTTSEG